MNRLLKPVMIAGTGSDVGKSVIAAAFCRILHQDGYKPAPFKAQNMALNSYVTPDGLEIGRAQAMQAEAARIDCSVDMNPILIKPTSDMKAQLVLNGRPEGNKSASGYFRKEGREVYIEAAHSAFDRLTREFNPIVLEGAGSIAEINLRELDLVNLSMARYAGASVILVADIDRGGVFASVYGSIMLLEPEERSLVKGIIINKFRGDITLFESGRKMLEQLCGIPVIAILPYFRDIHIEEEDSVSLERKNRSAVSGKINIAIVLLPHMSNFTDFDALMHDERLNVYYAANPEDISNADVVVVPGTKNSIGDCRYLHSNGMMKAIIDSRHGGKTILGICGGYQILGERLLDPSGIEGDIREITGAGLLPVHTIMDPDKITRRQEFFIENGKNLCSGYEIHNGRTHLNEGAKPFSITACGEPDGCIVDNKLMGTYMHGIFDNQEFVDRIVETCPERDSSTGFDFRQFKETQYDKLARLVRENTDMDTFYKLLQ